jgi:hypothetical protein
MTRNEVRMQGYELTETGRVEAVNMCFAIVVAWRCDPDDGGEVCW